MVNQENGEAEANTGLLLNSTKNQILQDFRAAAIENQITVYVPGVDGTKKTVARRSCTTAQCLMHPTLADKITANYFNAVGLGLEQATRSGRSLSC